MKNEYTASKSRKIATLLVIAAIGWLYVAAITTAHSHVLELHFNGYAIPSAITLLVCASLLFYFIGKPARTDERIWLTLYLSGLAIYTFGEVMQRLSATPEAALFWLHVRDPATIIAPALYLFTLAYTNRTERRYSGTTSILIIAALSFGFFYSFTSLLYRNDPASMHMNPWGYTPALVNAGLVSTLLIIDGLLVLSVATLINFRRHTRNDILRKQSLIFIFALSINIVIPTFTDAVLPAAGIPIPPLGVTLSTITGAILIYGLLRYQLLTINPTLFSNTILAIMQESVVATDEHFNIIFANTKAEGMLGIKAENQDRKSLRDIITRDSLPAFERAFAGSTMRTAPVTIDQIDIVSAHDSAPIPVRVASSRLQLGNYETRVMILSDITKELQTRGVIEHEVKVRTHELHEARAYLVSSINSLEQGFLLVNRHAKVELANAFAERLFTISEDTSDAQPLTAISKRVGWNVDLSNIADRVLASGKARHTLAAGVDGSFYEVYVTPVLADKEMLGATIIIQDITEQKILDRSKDEFFSIASHELRTPLTAIRGNMSMAKTYFPDAMKDQSLAAMVDDAHMASIRLIDIVSDFLDSSKLEQGKMVFSLESVAIEPVVRAVISDLGPILKQHDNTVTLQSLDKTPIVLVDKARLHQIIYNLLSNATKYSDHGTITITADSDAKHVTVRVSDTGKGISPENQKLLFHKFQQASESILTRDDTKGTGLGLYISKLLANNMHGDVMLEHSEEGKGSTFKLVLPVAKK